MLNLEDFFGNVLVKAFSINADTNRIPEPIPFGEKNFPAFLVV